MDSAPSITLRERAEAARASFKAFHAAKPKDLVVTTDAGTGRALQPAPVIVRPRTDMPALPPRQSSLLDLLTQHRGHTPASTLHQGRLRIFQPTRRPVMLEEVFCTPWGKVRIKGALGQAHADGIEAIQHVGREPTLLPDGRISLLVDQAEVRRIARQDGGSLRRVADDLMQGLVEIIEPAPLACLGHLIDHIDYRPRGADGAFIMAPNPLDGGQRHLWRVELGKALCRLLEADLWLYQDPGPIAALRHGISQAVARHVLGHKTEPRGGWILDSLIHAVAGDLADQALRNRRREVHCDADALLEVGILIEDGRVRRV